ncbi:MAG: putative TetR family transcriptional regulator [Frankiales bacterium]|nr:putative TetR family transcriptional regulator [Frankiales bacterium]
MEEAEVETGWDRRRRRVALHLEGVALELFADRGYRNVTVVEVAEAAGVATRTVARYFPLKEDLLLALPRRRVTGAIEELREVGQESRTIKEVWDVWAGLAHGDEDDHQRLELFWRAARDVPEILDRARGEQHHRMRLALTSLVRGCLDDGPDVDLHAEVLAAALQAANGAIVEHWMRGERGDDLAELFTSATAALAVEVSALAKPRRRRKAG